MTVEKQLDEALAFIDREQMMEKFKAELQEKPLEEVRFRDVKVLLGSNTSRADGRERAKAFEKLMLDAPGGTNAAVGLHIDAIVEGLRGLKKGEPGWKHAKNTTRVWLEDGVKKKALVGTWWNWSCKKRKVLYINFEIQDSFFWKRIQSICAAKGITIPLDDFQVWGLRGLAADIDKLLPEILRRTKAEGYGLIILDPSYKLLGERDENAAGDIASLMNALEQVAVKTGAAIAIGSHYSKGNQAGKNAIDRISGSGTFARDADSLVMVTAHQEENCFTIDCILRNNPPIQPFVMKWEYPLMRKQGMLDPKLLKGAAGRARQFNPDDLLS